MNIVVHKNIRFTYRPIHIVRSKCKQIKISGNALQKIQEHISNTGTSTAETRKKYSN